MMADETKRAWADLQAASRRVTARAAEYRAAWDALRAARKVWRKASAADRKSAAATVAEYNDATAAAEQAEWLRRYAAEVK